MTISRITQFLTLWLLCLGLVQGHTSEIMFEGYYRVELQGKHIGYTIHRFEFDPKTRTFMSKSFLRATFGEQLIQEGVTAKCSDKFKPISVQYTSQVGDTPKGVDASFKGEVMTATFSDGKKTRTETSRIPKGTFLSSFLPYLMLQKNLATGDSFKYSAVAEEDGASYDGRVVMQTKESKPGYDTYTLLNRFKAEEFISKMAIVRDPKTKKNVKGEVFSTLSPAKGIATQLVANPNQATEGHTVPNKIIMKVFGNIPTGKINLVSAPASVTIETPNVEPGPAIVPSPVPKSGP